MARTSKFSEAEIIGAIQQMEAGATQVETARKMGVSEQTMARWRAKYGGMTVSEAQEKRRLEDENRKLRQLVAQQALDIAALKEVVGKKW
jgi:putative transposase